MIKFLLLSATLFFAFKYGIAYITSEDFQAYGDRTKAEWTCKVNIFLAEGHIILSQYDKARPLFERVVSRCNKSLLAETASVRIAYCLENSGELPQALTAYRLFLASYPESEQRKQIERKVQILEVNR